MSAKTIMPFRCYSSCESLQTPTSTSTTIQQSSCRRLSSTNAYRPLNIHPGFISTTFRFQTKFYWPSILMVFLLIISSFITEINSIQINRFQVPEAVERGKSAILHCDYSLDAHEELYAIKFYKNNIEFFRYVPKENPPKQSYKLIGIYVNLKASNATHVVLSQTNLNSDGLYICEISTEGPIFSTVRSEQLMKIYVLPDQNIQIHGILDQYNYGDNISIVCKASKSWPPVKLEWLINDVIADSRYVINMSNERSTSSLVTSRIGLNIYAKPQYFKNGVLEIKCIATLTIVFEYEAMEHLVTGSSKNKNNKNEWSLQPNVRTPIITGMKKNYRLDEILNLNCSTRIRNAKLKWFINLNEANESDLIRYDRKADMGTLGLWIRMDKRHIQMSELKLRCISYFFKQIKQFNSTLKIRTYHNNNRSGWQTLSNNAHQHVYNRLWNLQTSTILAMIVHKICTLFV